MNYEKKITQIEAIIKQIELGSIPLEQVFEEFEIAQKLLKECNDFLAKGTERMNLLIETVEDQDQESDF